MLRFIKTSHGYVDRILGTPRRLTSVSHIHNQAKSRDAEIGDPGLSEPSSQGSHPWSEWVELMELLHKKGYFGGVVNPLDSGELVFKASNYIRTACLNFARDHYSVVRRLSRKDIRVIAGCGCPNIDRKVVNSGKRLRAHVGIEEGNVCGSCNLRGECERAYVKARGDEGARTIDVMRILLTYGLDPLISIVENRVCQTKFVEESVRKLLKEIAEYSSKETESTLVEHTAQNERGLHSLDADESEVPKKQDDWHCPKCNFFNFVRNLRCLRCDTFSEERLKQLRGEQDHLPLKKGDWICEMCNFLNFAKNTRCLRCREKPPKRQLNPGEWECESCNYINFRRNTVCLKCDHRRPKASNAATPSVQPKNDGAGDCKARGLKTWRFIEEETGKRQDHVTGNEDDWGFMDFPIEGGKSEVSRSVQKRETWKSEMLQRMKNEGVIREEDSGEMKCDHERRRMELLGDPDDEELNDWFVPKR